MTGIYPSLTVHGLNSEFAFLKKEIESTPVSICVLAERYGVKGRLFVNNTRRKSVITGTGTSSNMRMTTSFPDENIGNFFG